MKPSIEIVGLTKQYDSKQAVNDITLTIHEGELLSLLGMNGAGKTTLIKMLCGLTKPSNGNAFVYGSSIVTESHKVRTLLSVAPQETAIASNLSVRENLELMASIHDFDGVQKKQKVNEMIERFSFQPYMKQRSKTLSGGWKRKLSIAMALISEPKILFLDEPTLGLDVISRRELWKVIEQLKGSTTIVLTTHYLEEAESLSDRVCIMKNGAIKAIGTVSELNKEAGANKFEDSFIRFVTEGEIA